MDRLDAMKVFVVTLDEGSLAAAGRKLGRSPAAVSRAIVRDRPRLDTGRLIRLRMPLQTRLSDQPARRL